MDIVENLECEHVSKIIPCTEEGSNGSKTCKGATCDFFDAQTRSKDADERSASIRKLLIALALCITFMCIEVVGGIKANSLAILTDAAHLLSDVAAFAISLFSLWVAGWEATPRKSYGYLRTEILGGFVSVLMIWILTGVLVYEAIVRLIHNRGEVKGFLMFLTSTLGLIVNIIMVVLLGHHHGHGNTRDHGHDHRHGDHGDHGHENHGHGSNNNHMHSHDVPVTRHRKKNEKLNINVQGAYLYVLGDSIQSIGVMIGGAIIWRKPEWKIIDLICTLIFSLIVLGTTIRMLKNILEVLMESTPRDVDAVRLEKGVCDIEEVVAIHELHIWAITRGKILLACHVKIRHEADANIVLGKITDYIN
ncbi:Zn2+ transporter [Handroanthus impetiginosus]|uniref:Zn2+ transporter n=1 Tax=Handroanthus impetiginosus TaxID=429701 RepID=A0A2G9GH62_9LAMI|nr:Zn2+ transporter [Handroanthus impetiginosus]